MSATAVTADSIVENIKRSLEDSGGSDLDQAEKRFYGVTVGWVMQPGDTLPLGRLQVRLPSVDSVDLIRFARVAVPMAGFEHGHYFIPNVGDEVLVAFEHGDLNAPVIIGSMWNAMSPPPLPSPLAQIRAIRTLAGNQIVITEAPPSIALQTAPTPPITMPAPAVPSAPYNTIMLSPAGIQIQAMTGMGIHLQAGPTTQIMLQPGIILLQSGSSQMVISEAGINITAAGSLGISAAGPCNITAPIVKIN